MKVNISVFDTFPILVSKKLTLREIRLSDAKQIFEMRSNQRVNQFIARPTMEAVESAEQLVERTLLAYHNRQGIGWAGLLKNSEKIIGTCGLNNIDLPNLRAEIGGELATEYWGKKIAIEVVIAIIQFGLYHMLLHTIEAKVSPDNRSAIYLLESLGFYKEAHFADRIYFNGQFMDMAVYTLIKGNENLGYSSTL